MVCIGMSKRDLENALLPRNPVREERVEAIAFYAKSAELELVWIVLDFMDFNLRVVNAIKAAIHEKTSVELSHIHVVTTHNHGGGTPDLQKLAAISAKCAAEAQRGAAPARMRSAYSETKRQISYMRRIRVPELDGVTSLFYGTSEKTAFDASPHIEYMLHRLREGSVEYRNWEVTERPYYPFAPGDPEIAAIQFVREDGCMIGSVVRFAGHATCCNRPDSFSSDYPWHIRHCIENAAGGTAMFLNGPCADIAPGNVDKDDGMEVFLGEYISGMALKALETTPFEPVTVLRDRIAEVRLPVSSEVLSNHVELPEQMPDELPQRLRYLERKKLRDTLPFLEEKYQEGESELTVTLPIHLGFLQLNDLYLVAYPGETFRATAAALKDAFPSLKICTVTEHGRTAMYIPPKEEYALGGYETTCMVTQPGAEAILRDRAIKEMKAFV